MIIGGYPESGDVEWLEFGGRNATGSLAKPTDLPRSSMSGSAANFVDGEVRVCGGNGVGNCYVYDLSNNQWNETASLEQPRYVFRWDFLRTSYLYVQSNLTGLNEHYLLKYKTFVPDRTVTVAILSCEYLKS